MTSKGWQILQWIKEQLDAMPESVFEKWFDDIMSYRTLDELSRILRERK